MIENVRVICDLKTLLTDVKKKGAIFYGLENSQKFLNAVRAVTDTVKDISDDEIIKSYRLFLKKLEQSFSQTPMKSLTSIGMIKTFLSKGAQLYDGIEVILHCISTAAIKISIESVVESLVSRYSNHMTSARQGTEEEHALEEMVIAENGPMLHHADAIIKAAMEEYWRKKKISGWHFVRRSENVLSYTGGSGKTIGKLLERKSKLPFME